MRRLALLLSMSAVLLAAAPAFAADGPVKQFPQSVTLGFYRGQVISYLDFGPVKLSKGNQGGAHLGRHQRRRCAAERGRYGPRAERLHAAVGRTHADVEGRRRSAKSARSRSAVDAAVHAGQVAVKAVPVVVNCPVL